MMPVKAVVRNGRLVVDEPTDLPEGTELELLPVDDIDDTERAALDAAIDEGIAQADRGEAVDADDVLRRLRGA